MQSLSSPFVPFISRLQIKYHARKHTHMQNQRLRKKGKIFFLARRQRRRERASYFLSSITSPPAPPTKESTIRQGPRARPSRFPPSSSSPLVRCFRRRSCRLLRCCRRRLRRRSPPTPTARWRQLLLLLHLLLEPCPAGAEHLAGQGARTGRASGGARAQRRLEHPGQRAMPTGEKSSGGGGTIFYLLERRKVF